MQFNMNNNILTSKYHHLFYCVVICFFYTKTCSVISCRFVDAGRFTTSESIERIIIAGLNRAPARVDTSAGNSIEFQYDAEKQLLVLRKPALVVSEEWSLTLQM